MNFILCERPTTLWPRMVGPRRLDVGLRLLAGATSVSRFSLVRTVSVPEVCGCLGKAVLVFYVIFRSPILLGGGFWGSAGGVVFSGVCGFTKAD